MVPKDLEKAGRFGNRRTTLDYRDYSIAEISQNTEKNTGNLKRLAVTQTSVKEHQLSMVCKTRNKLINYRKYGGDDGTNYSWCTWNSHPLSGKKIDGTGN